MVNKFLKKAVVFLAATASFTAQAADVETLPSGVRIEHLVRGDGAQPSANNSVTVHYRAILVATGTEVDSSYGRGPVTFNLRQVIPCWTEGLQHIASGGKAVLVCPARTAYGSRGAGAIPPDQDLRFAVELLNVR